jgi:hypothetical protein
VHKSQTVIVQDVVRNLIEQRITAAVNCSIKSFDVRHTRDVELRTFAVGDLFVCVSGGGKARLKDCSDVATSETPFPIVSASKFNNGHSGKFSGAMLADCGFTVAKNGSVGHCFYQDAPFDATGDICVLKARVEFKGDLHVLAQFISQNLTTKSYTYTYKLNKQRLMCETLSLPVDADYNIVSIDTLCDSDSVMNSFIENFRINMH